MGQFRAYRVEAGIDLFGVWLVDVTYGRIGTRGTSPRYVIDNEAGARKVLRHDLRCQTIAKQRIGVGYQVSEVTGPKTVGKVEGRG